MRCSPSPDPVLITAAPPSFSVVRTSAKSRLIFPSFDTSSAILRAAFDNESSALAKAVVQERSGYILHNRSLLITNKASTCFRISSTPAKACNIFGSPSKRNGIVTMPTVSTPFSLAIRATTGAAPVPVPPPIPAVIKAMRVLSSNKASTSAALSSANFLATSGMFPAPSPLAPNCTFTGTGEFRNACASVLQRTKLTPPIP